MAELDAVESLDSLTFYLPLPYRIAIIVVFGVFLWGLNLQGLSNLQIVRVACHLTSSRREG